MSQTSPKSVNGFEPQFLTSNLIDRLNMSGIMIVCSGVLCEFFFIKYSRANGA
ncbi:hypothetical protein Pan161_07260 [Gimesia algae]|uniref:Uncharacterized protein n=1 Tax=Gimesia algae TaxID=2527971 RepID=A0A517V7W9_9PLAN|nr:hypothetical protein Pan161_07260 [Gimesia algae]